MFHLRWKPFFVHSEFIPHRGDAKFKRSIAFRFCVARGEEWSILHSDVFAVCDRVTTLRGVVGGVGASSDTGGVIG